MVESYLGSVESWPSNVLMDMFAEKPEEAVIKSGGVYVWELCDSE